MKSAAAPPPRTAWFIWGLGALFYLMGFFQRVAPAVMTGELMREFHISAAALGNLSAFYFYSYVAMQIPTGILADIWGPRRLLSLGALVAGAGTLLFALAPGIALAGAGRLLIGGSVAVAFVGLLKLSSNWFPPRQFAMVSGMALLFGIIGAVCAGPPLRLLVDRFGWRSAIMASALVTFAICAAIRIYVRDYPHEKGYQHRENDRTESKGSNPSVASGIIDVFRYRNTALLFLIPAGIVGPVLTFSGLWGVPFIATHHGLSPARAASLTTALLVAWAISGPFFGWFSDRIGSRKPLYIIGSALALAGWIITIYTKNLPIPVLVAVLVLTGFCSGCMILSFAFAKESVPRKLSGTVSGVVNMGVMSGPMLLQPAVGWMLDRTWNGEVQEGVRIYSMGSYQAGFSLMVAWAVLAVALLFFTRETHCRQTE